MYLLGDFNATSLNPYSIKIFLKNQQSKKKKKTEKKSTIFQIFQQLTVDQIRTNINMLGNNMITCI